jgi:hypothetical protein
MNMALHHCVLLGYLITRDFDYAGLDVINPAGAEREMSTRRLTCRHSGG